MELKVTTEPLNKKVGIEKARIIFIYCLWKNINPSLETQNDIEELDSEVMESFRRDPVFNTIYRRCQDLFRDHL